MKNVYLFLLASLFIFTLSSCNKDDDGGCKNCSAVQLIYVDGQEIGSQSISAQQFCGEALDQIEANPTVTAEQNIAGTTQEIVITYTCQ